ncbi:S9 family peptidase [Komagataeibacter xylinus]|uniref:S9 family peptidase n=1 Tax=Komagataeibacter xylinus TaxID=28448 RepID=A0A318PQY1_KOMXY|nr:S9 family peptidase [Komagataeibacter xylinus]AZV38379.1 S9 family peptidase [Komagataeibacter xylinus]PYD58890.1 S9 family peptidase [Komagataeibacter xylinus]GBQ77219.1 oligopeptidase B [Komagataeibacter xylinus NBRC 15237]
MTTPPIARQIPHAITQLGRTRHDEYAWMKDDNWQEVLRDPTLLRPDIAGHLRAENAYTQSVLSGTDALQDTLVAEMKGRMQADDTYPPTPHGPYNYQTSYTAGAQYPVYKRYPTATPTAEEVLLDVNEAAKGHEYYAVAAAAHSPDHSLFAHAEDTQGSEIYRIHIRRLAGDSTPLPPVENCSGAFVFSPDSAFLFWVWRDSHGRPARVYRRRIGADHDTLVYEEADPGFFVGVEATRSGGWIIISSGNHDTSESWLIPGHDPQAAPRCASPRETGLIYGLYHQGTDFIILTNADGAYDFKLMTTPDTAPTRANWRDLVAHEPGRYITECMVWSGHLAWRERRDANTRIIIRSVDGATEALEPDEAAYDLTLVGGYEYDTTELRYIYQSPTTPRAWHARDMVSGAETLLKQQQVPSGHDPAQYRCWRLMARAADGELVPVTVLGRHDTPIDGSAPLLLYGYGAYGHAIDPVFSTRTLSLVDRGWFYAIAHVRGGSEKGWNWFLGGRGRNKPNTFSDFIACAETLVAEGFGATGRIVADGRSAGGMVMGAIANMRPDLFAGIVAVVPFVDELNTMSDASLPLTPPEWPEWGNPVEDVAAYDLIASYAAYEQVAPRAYPAILAMGGLTDPRVTYWEPAKWVARLRAHNRSARPIMLRTNMEAGHRGATGRFDSLREAALIHAFALWAIETAPARQD